MTRAGSRLAILLTVAAVALLSGCIVIPVDYHASGSRRNVSEDVQPKLQPGVTTKEEVFLLLGEPDHVSEDGQRLGYKWTKVKALVIYGAYYSGGVAEVPQSHVLFVTFDANDRVSEVGIASAWGTATPTEDRAPARR